MSVDDDDVVIGTLVEGKRWLDGGYMASNIATITEDVVAVTTKNAVKFIFIRSGKSRLYLPKSDGVGVVAGRDDLGLLGWSERSPPPHVYVYQYNNPNDTKVRRLFIFEICERVK